MSKLCKITGKKPMMGNKVSHANNKTKRSFNLNLSKKRFFIKNKWILLKVSSAGIKTINKLGIEKTLKCHVKKKY
ncbi:50S ribosomal protein L28 [Candidatus Karelsulcia muelleri]|uniref:50S ribosomal protein L28 n=1 Tax=Candidatus Karelsulcia muelleri TaxID=336810 RepID=UPI0007F9CC55|nr:50S ribosomal protein L28 [Candidatus Karelsulcia muelleri]ANO35704.1 50S ribosomal protein L28 [Candidatus Karelsulcia muelleri]QSF25092.1 50S ribosomal protein L28 [Candidatus Karelsulcia muelleri]WKD87172.1 50S ribosomal protein L28 [Candidatus Karelsulcia muelleri]BEH03788.1 50S ribosomal protein L28 [Candidatus Karelsulcia muelleri]